LELSISILHVQFDDIDNTTCQYQQNALLISAIRIVDINK